MEALEVYLSKILPLVFNRVKISICKHYMHPVNILPLVMNK